MLQIAHPAEPCKNADGSTSSRPIRTTVFDVTARSKLSSTGIHQLAGLALLVLACLALPGHAQEVEIPPQDTIPSRPQEPIPDRPPDAPENPEELLPTPPPSIEEPAVPPEVLETNFFVTEIGFDNNMLFDDETLLQVVNAALTPASQEIAEVASSNWMPANLSVSQLLQLAQAVSDLYARAGYTASGALVRIPPDTRSNGRGPIVFDVQEGAVESIEVIGTQGLRAGYVRSRLGISEGKPLNVDLLQEKLQLLQLDPLIRQIRAEVNAGANPGTSLVTVSIEEARSFDMSLGFNNSRTPSVGTKQRQIFLTEANLLGIGDELSVGYSNTRGSDSLSASYRLPLGSDGASLSFSYNPGWNDIIESEFFDINQDGRGPDIESRSESYEVSLRYPAIRSVQNQTFQELGFSLAGSLRDSRSFLLDEPFPLSPGASEKGEVRVVALRFGQDYTLRDASQVFAVRSRFSFGLDALNSTINEPIPDVEEIPDSRFFSWLGQLQWVRVLAPDTLFLMRGNLQFANQVLLSAEQFGIGGFGNVRGYRQDRLLTDNGVFASAEVRVPILRIPEWVTTVQAIPFAEFGRGWNSGSANDPDPNTLASVGIGLQWQTGNDLTARIDYGIPLIDAGSTGNTLQENGLYFSLVYTPF